MVEYLDSDLVAFCTSTSQLNESKLREYAKKFLPDYMVPTRMVFLAEMPCNINGKIDRQYLISSYKNCNDKEAVFRDAPLNEFEEALFELFSKYIDNFDKASYQNYRIEDIGLDSISFVHLIVDLEDKFCFEFEDEKLSLSAFETLYELGEYIKKHI